MGCQRILIHFLLLISHKLPAIAKCPPLPYLIPDHYRYSVPKMMVYIKRSEEEGRHDVGGGPYSGPDCS